MRSIHELINIYVGVPYKARKDDKKGMDCYQCAQLFYREGLGLYLSDHVPNNTHHFYEYWCSEYGWEFPWHKLQPWDLLLVHPILRPVDHCSIVVDTEKLVHSIEPVGVVVEPIQRYKNRVFQIVRPRILGEEYDDQARGVILRKATLQKEKTYGDL